MSEAGNSGPQTPAKPPKGKPFQPGQSGNPSGRPKAWKEFRDALRVHAPEATDKLLEAVRAGERWAVELTLAYCWGKPAQVIADQDGEGGPALVVQVVRYGDDPAA